MKTKMIQIATAALMAGGLAVAQTAAPAPAPRTHRPGYAQREARRGEMREKMMQELNLTADQQAKAKTIFGDSWQNSKPIFEQLKQNDQAMQSAVRANDTAKIKALSVTQGNLRGQLMANHQTAMAKFYQILTPEQRTKADAMHARAQSRMQERFNQMRRQHEAPNSQSGE